MNKPSEPIQTPTVLSISRATDVPAFYMEWLLERFRAGYCLWKNPFSGKFSKVSFANVRAMVFWSKNPKPLLEHLEDVARFCPNFYIQFTLNDYDLERFEPAVPPVEERLATFRALSERLGKERVIWRFDPLLLTPSLPVERLLEKVKRLGDALCPHTRRLVFSFIDIKAYASVQEHLRRVATLGIREFTEAETHAFAKGLQHLNQAWGLELNTCSEAADLSAYGINPGHCVDGELLARLFGANHPDLLEALGYEQDLFGALLPKRPTQKKDNGQRKACGCAPSKDIGAYNTCPHLCLYCYANHRPTLIQQVHQTLLSNPHRESLSL